MTAEHPLTSVHVRDALQPVQDPELGYSIVDLGLVRGIDVYDEGRKVLVYLTLTSPMCPLGPEIIAATKAAASDLPGVEQVDVELVWQPRWDPRVDASEEVKAELGVWV